MKRQGFTLIEILVAITIIALITALAIPGFNYAFRTSTESFARQMAAVFREAKDRALLTRQLVRIKIDLTKQAYWVEAAGGNYILPSEEEIKRQKEDLFKKDEEQEESAFAMVKEITRDKKTVPYGMKINKVQSPRYKEALTEGEAEIYYFPSGISDAAVVELEDSEKVKRSLSVNPVTGIATLELGAKEDSK